MVALLCLAASVAAPPPAPDFDSFTVTDPLGRTTSSYLSPEAPGKKLPVLLFIGGSGGQSVWPMRDGQLGRGLQNLLLSVAKDHFRVLVVEKPGVPLGFCPPRPGSAEGSPAEFLREHTLERWTLANQAALRHALGREGVDPSRVAVAGHSEGGIVAASLAAREPKVTDLAILAGGGPNQAEDLAKFFGQERISQMLEEVRQDPDSIQKFQLGHPHLRWSSFLKTSTMEEALRSKTRVFIAQGTEDRAVDPAGAEILFSALKKQGRSVTLHKVEGGDHGFSTDPEDRTGGGFRSVFRVMLDWLTASSASDGG